MSTLSVRNLTVEFGKRGGLFRQGRVVRAVQDVSFDLAPGTTLGLVGESGCGKSTTGLAAMRLIEAQGGRVLFGDTDILTLTGADLRALRSKIQIVFQDPFSSLNPRLTAAEIISEPLDILGVGTRAERRTRVDELLTQVGLTPEHGSLFPHQFSGGQRQRLGIARALAPDPDILVCDEAVSALDVAIQAQVLNLLAKLQQDRGFAMLFISHDLSVVRHVSDDVIVMYLGRIVEHAKAHDLFGAPLHPYTIALISAIPSRDLDRPSTRIRLEGDVPSPVNVPSGCAFHNRCPFAEPRCREDRPELREISKGRFAACHFAGEIELP
jgi:oligopeptide/dipeptide ABC transporter ATP-binding protein